MTTLRARLTVWLLGALIVVGSGSAVFVYLRAREATQGLLDYQLQQVARLVAARKIDPTVPTAGRDVDPASDAREDILVTVRDESGAVRYSTETPVPLPTPAPGFSERRIGGHPYRVYGLDTGARTVAVAQSLDVQREAALGGALAVLLPVVVLLPVLALLIGYGVRRGLVPLEASIRSIAERSPLALDPVPAASQPEDLRPLVDAMNRLLARLAESLEHERRFVGDAAHALRTPIAALQLQADVLETCRDPAERGARFAELKAGIRRIVRLTHHLLALAGEARDARHRDAHTPVEGLFEEVAGLYGPLAVARGVRIVLEPEAEGDAPGDLGRLMLIVGNLLENALRYSPEGGVVRLRAERDGEALALEVIDEGPGLPEAEIERVFERFYRAPNALEGGSGLGLATARTIAERLGGQVTLANRRDQSGLVARVTLPSVRLAAAA
ncbi:MAG: sensor histidine kinase N-terminal domain-containing protein [Proteobacteria bacterium]|nr:sensor histidine kinase N-terminal domain-containing protein [Pseudomonadota bacterium]